MLLLLLCTTTTTTLIHDNDTHVQLYRKIDNTGTDLSIT